MGTSRRRKLLWSAGSTIVCAAALVAMATPAAGQRGGRGGRGGFGSGSPLLAAIDSDRDNTVSPAEISDAAGRLRSLDRDEDGRLAGPELLPAGRGEGRGEGRGGDGPRGAGEAPGDTPPTSPDELAEILMAFDDNADGRLTAGELPERFSGLLGRADADKDGALTPDEIKASAAETAEPTTGRGRGRGGRGPGPFVDPLLTALDRDGDGALSADEITLAPDALRGLDRNGDGGLTVDETGAGRGQRRGGFGG